MKEKKQQRLVDVFMPSSPAGWFLTGALFLFFLVNPFGMIDRIFDLMDKGVEYRAAVAIVVFFISLPFYLRLRKKLHKYQEGKWDA